MFEAKQVGGRMLVSTGTPWEAMVGYSRVVRAGNLVFVCGTMAATPGGEILSPGHDSDAAYGQTKAIFEKIEAAMAEAGATLADVVRTRLFVTDITLQEAVGRAHYECFGDVRPAATMVEIAKLAHPQACVEIEVDAVVSAPSS